MIPWLSVAVILFLLLAAKADELQAVAIALSISAIRYLFRRKPLAA